MSTYTTRQRSNYTYEQPNYPQNSTSEKQVTLDQTYMNYEVSPVDSQTKTQELTKEAVEHATEAASVKFFMQAGETICTYRISLQNQ